MMPVAGTTKRIIAGRGERGMSMPLVLLLFLVCTVAASITITAATTAAGRATNLAEDDRLFYSASSAATVLTREISESNVKFSVTKTGTDDNPTYTLNVVREDTAVPVNTTTDLSLVEWASVVAFFGVDPKKDVVTSDAIKKAFDGDTLVPLDSSPASFTPPERSFEASLSLGPGSSITPPKVFVSVKANIDWSFAVTVTAIDAEDLSSNNYRSTREVLFTLAPGPFSGFRGSIPNDFAVTCTPTVEETGV